MSNIICIFVILALLIPAALSSLKHMRGEGDCCGGPKEKVPKKKLAGKKLYDYVISIEGMHCDACKNRIIRKINSMDGLVCKVSLSKKQAIVSCYEDTAADLIKDQIEMLDFKVVKIDKR